MAPSVARGHCARRTMRQMGLVLGCQASDKLELRSKHLRSVGAALLKEKSQRGRSVQSTLRGNA